MTGSDAKGPASTGHWRAVKGAPAFERPADWPDRFELQGVLGEGGQNRVYVGRERESGRLVAIARVDRASVRRVEVDRFRELGAMEQLNAHPLIAAPEEVLETKASVYVVSAYIEGGDLGRRLERSAPAGLALAAALSVTAQVARALAHAHACGVTHCDIKPANVLLDAAGDAHVCDFGLARVSGVSHGFERELVGTPAYLSPEQISGDEVGPPSDLYSLGCLLYELLTGRPPFVGENASEVVNLHLMARPTPPTDRDPSIPMALSDLVLKLLEKEPSARPSSAQEVAVALEGILDGWTAVGLVGEAAGEDPGSLLVGRGAELERFDRVIADARSGRSHVLLLQGEAGLGKSSLLRALASRANRAGFLVLFGQAAESPDTGYGPYLPPYGPFVSAMLPLAARLSEVPAVHARMLRDLLFLDEDERRESDSSERGVQHHRLFAAVASALSALAQSRPIALVLDDLHWADSASLDLLQHLASALDRRAGPAHHEILLVGCYRSVDPAHPLHEKLGALLANGLVEDVVLAPLDENGVGKMLEQLRVAGATDQLVHRLHQITQGNPLFVRELVERMERRGGTVDADGVGLNPLLDEGAALPASVESAIDERVQALDPAAIALLTTASFLGARFARSDLQELVEASESLDAKLDSALRAGLLLRSGAEHRFAHPLIRHVLQRRVEPGERERQHLGIARMLAEGADGDRPLRELEIAHHLRLAGPLANPAELIRHSVRAADLALAKFASHEAAMLIQAALDAVAQGYALPAGEHAALHAMAGLAFFRRLDKEPCLAHYDAAARGYREVGDRVGLVYVLHERLRAAVWLGVIGYGSVSEDVATLEQEVRQLPVAEVALRARTLNTLCESYWTARRHEDALRVGAEAFECADRIGSDQLRAEVSINLGLAHYQGVQLEQSMSCWRIGVEHGRRAGDLSSTARCLQRILLAQISLGRLDDATRGLPEVHEMNRILQLPGETSMTHSAEAVIATLRGDYGSARASCDEALEHVRRSKYPWGLIVCVPIQACANALRGDAAAAHRAIDHYLDPKLTFEEAGNIAPMADALRWLVDYYVGDPVAIPQQAVDGLIAALPVLEYDVMVLTMACNAVEFAEALRSPELAASAREALRPAERDGVVFALGWPVLVPRLIGVASSLLGEWEAAVRELGHAIELGVRLGADVEAARARLALAEMLSLRNEEGDRERAAELLCEAMPTLRTISRTVFFERAEKLERYLAGA